MTHRAPVKAPLRLTLLQDVPGLGALGEVVKVSPGYARNYLVPRGLATRVGADTERRVVAIRKRHVVEAAKAHDDAKTAAQALSATSVHVEAKAGEGGHLYGSVTQAMVAAALAKEGYQVPEAGVLLEQPIKELGIYEVPIKLHADVQTTVKLYVVQPPPEKSEKAEKGEKAK